MWLDRSEIHTFAGRPFESLVEREAIVVGCVPRRAEYREAVNASYRRYSEHKSPWRLSNSIE
jgi:hypothetical protein